MAARYGYPIRLQSRRGDLVPELGAHTSRILCGGSPGRDWARLWPCRRSWRQFWARLGRNGAAGIHLANELGVPDAFDPQPALSIPNAIDSLWHLVLSMMLYGSLQTPFLGWRCLLPLLGVTAFLTAAIAVLV